MLATLYFTQCEISPMGQTGYNREGGRGGGALVVEEAGNEDEEWASEQAGACVEYLCVCVHLSVCKKKKHVCRVRSECVYGLCKCIALHKSSVVCRCLCALCVMSTRRADLDDKRVILPCWVAHLKDSHFSGSSVEGSMMEREGWTGRMLRSVCACGAEEKERT